MYRTLDLNMFTTYFVSLVSICFDNMLKMNGMSLHSKESKDSFICYFNIIGVCNTLIIKPYLKYS